MRSSLIVLTGITISLVTITTITILSLLYSCRPNKQNSGSKLIIKGSETELPLVSNYGYEFQELNGIEINVTGGGSNAGLSDLIDQKIDIANSSRIVTNEEKEILLKKNIKWNQAIIGVDAVAIITHRSLHIENISLDQLTAIFNGKITNWEQIGSLNRPIRVYGRKPSSGTHDFMKHRLHIENYSDNIREFDTYADIISAVKNDSNAVAYISSSAIKQNMQKSMQEVSIINVFMDNSLSYSPFDEEAIYSGDYPLIRPLFQYFDATNKNSDIKKFVQFEISERGQGLLKLYGYYKINVFHRQINKFNGFF